MLDEGQAPRMDAPAEIPAGALPPAVGPSCSLEVRGRAKRAPARRGSAHVSEPKAQPRRGPHAGFAQS